MHTPLPLPVERALRKLGHDLSLARRRRRMTQASLAERIGASTMTVRRMEQGNPLIPLQYLARAMQVFGELERIRDSLDTANDAIGLTLMDEQVPRRVRSPRKKAGKPDSDPGARERATGQSQDRDYAGGRRLRGQERAARRTVELHQGWSARVHQLRLRPKLVVERGLLRCDLPLVAGHQVRKAATEVDSCFHFALADTEPDAWGRRVIARAHARARQHNRTLTALTELDYLTAVDDFSRVAETAQR